MPGASESSTCARSLCIFVPSLNPSCSGCQGSICSAESRYMITEILQMWPHTHDKCCANLLEQSTHLSSLDMCLEIINLLCPERMSYRGNEATGNWLERWCAAFSWRAATCDVCQGQKCAQRRTWNTVRCGQEGSGMPDVWDSFSKCSNSLVANDM